MPCNNGNTILQRHRRGRLQEATPPTGFPRLKAPSCFTRLIEHEDLDMTARDWRFPMTCPACSAAAGDPHKVTSDGGLLVLELQCALCHQHWEISAPVPPLFFKPRPDRRTTATRQPAAADLQAHLPS
jgi:hypothetical protein